MSSGTSHKPIVFVFGAEKGDAAARKRNLSAINTQVAYRAHERRREKNFKSRQRAQAKEPEKSEELTSTPTSESSPSSAVKAEPAVDFRHPLQLEASQHSVHDEAEIPVTASTSTVVTSAALVTIDTFTTTLDQQPSSVEGPANFIVPRKESDLVSNISSDRDIAGHDAWSASPSSIQQSTPSSDVSPVSPLAPVSINGYFDSALDPFFKLPAVASDREKWLVHFYFREMGHVGFGTHSNALFCPDRDWVSKYVSSKSLCFQWILILAEEHLERLGVPSNQTKTIERKARAYGSLNSILRNGSTNRDEGVSGIMYAAIVDVARTSMHLMALDRYINETGGLDAFLDGPLGITHPEHVATVYAFGPCPIASLDDLETIKGRFIHTLRKLHHRARVEQKQKRNMRNRRPWDTQGCQVVDANGVLVPANIDEHFKYYVRAQQDCLSSTCMAQLLNSAPKTNTDYSTQARHLAALLQTLLILNEFDDSYLARAMYLKRLKYVAEMSSAIDPATSQPLLSHGGLLLINSFVRQEVQTHFDRTKILTKGVMISKNLVDFMKIFALLHQETRCMITEWLRNWLCYDEQVEGLNFVHLDERNFNALAAAITDAWSSGTKVRPG